MQKIICKHSLDTYLHIYCIFDNFSEIISMHDIVPLKKNLVPDVDIYVSAQL